MIGKSPYYKYVYCIKLVVNIIDCGLRGRGTGVRRRGNGIERGIGGRGRRKVKKYREKQ